MSKTKIMNKRYSALLLITLGLSMMSIAALAKAAETPSPEPQLQAAISDSNAQQSNDLITHSPNTTHNAEFTDQACLDCHTDQERLVELAVEEEVVEAPSEGPG